mgnify:CR=1 FL=1
MIEVDTSDVIRLDRDPRMEPALFDQLVPPPGDAMSEAWTEISQGGLVPLVVRSSSTAEDGAETSMAGRFRSVVGVTGWDAFESAVAAGADLFVTGDADLLEAELPIRAVSPRVFWEMARAGFPPDEVHER